MKDKFETREAVNFESGGKKLFGVIHRPLIEGKAPAVLCCHGFGGTKVGRNRLWVMMAEALSQVGVTTLRFDFRGCGDSEGIFSEMTLEGCIQDALAAIQFLENDEKVDSGRMGIVGTSLGGAIAVLTAVRSLKFSCMALWAAVANAGQWQGEWEEFKELQEHYQPNLYLQGDERGASKEFLKQFVAMRPDKELEKLGNMPLLHIHGSKDDVVHESHHAESYKKSREEEEAESVFLSLPNSDHWFSHEQDRPILLQETAKWFKNIL